MAKVNAKKKGPAYRPDVRVGDVWRSGDPRDGSRTIRVTKVAKDSVSYVNTRTDLRGNALRDRFNGKKSGYILVERDGAKVSS